MEQDGWTLTKGKLKMNETPSKNEVAIDREAMVNKNPFDVVQESALLNAQMLM